MKQNKHQLEHLPTLLVQQIRLQWYKDCRGGNAAAQRNQYPRAMRRKCGRTAEPVSQSHASAERLLLLLSFWSAYSLCIYHTEARWISDR